MGTQMGSLLFSGLGPISLCKVLKCKKGKGMKRILGVSIDQAPWVENTISCHEHFE
jgi:hypothetical protein